MFPLVKRVLLTWPCKIALIYWS